jgi:glyoxylase-like metal-dependent hydrolase (beta-lactamase superfamily II)
MLERANAKREARMAKAKTAGLLQKILPGVFLVPANGRKGFGYWHFVQRPKGNLILDASRMGSASDAFDEIDARGGVKALIISDRHLGGPPTNEIAERFGAKIYCSEIEAAAMGHRSNKVVIDHLLPFARKKIEGDVLLVPTPGHTEGQFAALITLGKAKMLFTSDFVWRENGKWRPGNLSRKKMVKSFEALRDLDFNYVVPWTSYTQDEFFVPVKSVSATVDEMIAACPRP